MHQIGAPGGHAPRRSSFAISRVSSHPIWMMLPRIARPLFVLACAAALMAQTQPLLPENTVTRVTEHVYAIVGWPNVGIITGDRATLVVDTGMGPRNGATVLREAKKLSKTAK